MDNENAVAAEPSIGDLRAMLSDNAPVAAAPSGGEETPAPAAKADGEPAPASEPVVNETGTERGPDGKFKAAEPTDPEETPGVKKRIGKLLADKRAAELRAEAAEAALQAKPGSQPAKETAPPAAAADTDKKPELKDFDSYEEFNEKLLDWKIDQTRKADAKVASDRTEKEREAAATTAWKERVAKVAKDVHTDYEDVIAEAADLPISAAMNRVIFESDRGPELAYHLAKNPDDAARIAKLGPLAAARELGKIEAKFAAPAAAPVKPAVKPLPKPAAAVGGSAAPHVVDLNDPKIDMKTFKAEFRKRLSN